MYDRHEFRKSFSVKDVGIRRWYMHVAQFNKFKQEM
jgi:hypothetical protein